MTRVDVVLGCTLAVGMTGCVTSGPGPSGISGDTGTGTPSDTASTDPWFLAYAGCTGTATHTGPTGPVSTVTDYDANGDPTLAVENTESGEFRRTITEYGDPHQPVHWVVDYASNSIDDYERWWEWIDLPDGHRVVRTEDVGRDGTIGSRAATTYDERGLPVLSEGDSDLDGTFDTTGREWVWNADGDGWYSHYEDGTYTDDTWLDAKLRTTRIEAYIAEALPHFRIAACKACGVYLKEANATVDGRVVPLVDDLASAVLDVWAIQQGFVRDEPNLAGL